MQLRISIIAFLLVLILISSCEKEEISEFTDTPIIESYLKPGDYFNLKVSRQISFSSDVTYSSEDIDHLIIHVTVDNNTHTLQPIGDGQYIDSSLIVSEHASYDLSFQFNSKNVNAYTYVPSKPVDEAQSATTIYIEKRDSTFGPPSGISMPEPVNITWHNSDHSYYLIVVENIEINLEPIRDFGGNAPPSNFFRKKPTNLSSEEIRPMEFQYYGMHRIIIYHVLPDYANLYDQNNTSSQNLSNPSTSITNGYGIFTGLNSDTLMISVKKP